MYFASYELYWNQDRIVLECELSRTRVNMISNLQPILGKPIGISSSFQGQARRGKLISFVFCFVKVILTLICLLGSIHMHCVIKVPLRTCGHMNNDSHQISQSWVNFDYISAVKIAYYVLKKRGFYKQCFLFFYFSGCNFNVKVSPTFDGLLAKIVITNMEAGIYVVFCCLVFDSVYCRH